MPVMRCCRRALLALLALALALPLAAPAVATAAEAEPQAPLPGFAELEAAGARIGEIRIRTGPIFDPADPGEDKLLFRWADKLHARTRPSVIEGALLFKSGEPVSVALINETERVLRTSRYLYDVQIRPAAVHDGVVDIEIATRDTWTLDPGFSASRAGGATSSGFQVKDYNLAGTGVTFGIGRSRGVDRSGTEFEISDARAFGGWTALSYKRQLNSDGRLDEAKIEHPFYALDTPWAAGASVLEDRRLDPVYRGGEVVAQYRHVERRGKVWGGLAVDRVDRWVQRWSAGVDLQDDGYALHPGVTPPDVLPEDERLIGPFVRWELLEDRYEKLQNRNLIARPEFFNLGLEAHVQLGYASTRFGASRDAWRYDLAVSRGFEPFEEHTLVAASTLEGQFSEGRTRRMQLGAQAQYYLPQNPHWLFYASLSGDVLKRPDAADLLLLGGDNGLRGFPLRYQTGDRRLLLTVEERAFSDVYVARLFRLGAAAFLDVGRAWGVPGVNTGSEGWLANVGLGLRIASVRSAFGNVLHVDLAAPVNAPDGVKRLQFLVKSRTSF